MARRSELARGVAFGWLDLDDIGAEIAELLRGPRAQHDRRAVENSYSGQRTRHVRLPPFLFFATHHSAARQANETWQKLVRNFPGRSQTAHSLCRGYGVKPLAEKEATMRDVTKRQLTWRNAMAAAIAGFAVLTVAAGAQAHDERHWKHHRHHGHHFVPPGHVYYSAPVIYAPRPVVYSAPVYYDPGYYPPQGLSLNFNVPLR